MDLHKHFGLRHVINARGTYTPLGVSRSPEPVIEVASEAFRHFFDMAELQDTAGRVISDLYGCEWATITNCAAAGITLSVAAAMTGTDMEKVAQLPDASGMANGVVIPAGHLVNYGHPNEQAIRLAGARVLIAGDRHGCTAESLEQALGTEGVVALLLTDSRLCQGENVPNPEAVELAHRRDIPVILDGAAQDLRLPELLATGADLVLISAQKYLSAPTAGLVMGRRDLVDAVRLQDKGIGRGMKAGKEAVLGALAALEHRQKRDMGSWEKTKKEEAKAFAEQLTKIPFVTSKLVRDPTGGPFWRVHATFDPEQSGKSATEIAKALREGRPRIFPFETLVEEGTLNFELISLSKQEHGIILNRLAEIINGSS